MSATHTTRNKLGECSALWSERERERYMESVIRNQVQHRRSDSESTGPAK